MMTRRTRVTLRVIAVGLAAVLAVTMMKLMHPHPAPAASASIGSARPQPRPLGAVTARMARSIRTGMTQDQVKAVLGPPQLTNAEMNEVNRRLLLRAGKEPSHIKPDPDRSGWFYRASDGGAIGIGFTNHVVTLVTAAPS